MQASVHVEATVGGRQAALAGLAALSRLIVYIDQAALFMSAAFAAADIRDFAPGRRRQTIRPKGDATRWYADLTNDFLTRLSEIRDSLAHGWPPSSEADALAAEAVALLAELTPVPSQIIALYRSDRATGLAELARHLKVVDRQYALAASLVGRLEAGEGGRPSPESAPGFVAAREALLAAAGGALSLTEAAQALGVTRQNLHKRIHSGSALGMLLHDRIVVPKLQLVEGDDKKRTIIAGIGRVLQPFLETKAGAWSALQFLLDPDPNLGRPPIEALRAGDIAGAEHAARAYLAVDDG